MDFNEYMTGLGFTPYQDDDGNQLWRGLDGEGKLRTARPLEGITQGYQWDKMAVEVDGWEDHLWGDLKNFVDHRYDYKTNPSKPPKFDDFAAVRQKTHFDTFGMPLNRPWNNDPGMMAEKNELDRQYQAAVDEYNQMYGKNLQIDPSFLGVNSRAGVTAYMDAQPMQNRNESGFFKQPFGQALLGLGLGALGGWGLAGFGAETAAGAIGGLSAETAGMLQAAGYSAAEIASIGAQFGAGGALTGLGGGGAAGLIGGGAGGSGLSAETLSWMQAAGYSPAEIASIGAQFGADGILTGLGGALEGGIDGWDYLGTDEVNGGFPSGSPELPGGGTSPSLLETLKKIPGLSNLLSGDSSGLLGKVLGAGLGAYASNQQSNALTNLANKYDEYGQDSRRRYEETFKDGFTMAKDPGYMDSLNMASKSNLHALSTGGNPALSPNAQSQNMQDLFQKNAYPALQSYRSGNANAGGLATFNAAVPQLQTQAIGSNANMYNALGSGIADVFSPPKTSAQTLAELLKAFK
tara:strand:- start:771 stop:2330 length:1560 start_codon:yes stop_codon:yes gene_type:complete